MLAQEDRFRVQTGAKRHKLPRCLKKVKQPCGAKQRQIPRCLKKMEPPRPPAHPPSALFWKPVEPKQKRDPRPFSHTPPVYLPQTIDPETARVETLVDLGRRVRARIDGDVRHWTYYFCLILIVENARSILFQPLQAEKHNCISSFVCICVCYWKMTNVIVCSRKQEISRRVYSQLRALRHSKH